jgi:hypothetical protein
VPLGLTTTTQYRRITISTQNTVVCESVPTGTVQVTVQTVPTAGTITVSQQFVMVAILQHLIVLLMVREVER